MKKLSFLIVLSFFSFSLFAERAWNDRIFEINTEIPLNVTNNTIGLTDILKSTVVLDLTQMADNMPEDGFNTIISFNPSVTVRLDIPSGMYFGVKTGLDVYSNFSIGKSLFDFLGHGNTLNEDLDIGFGGYVDAFSYAQIDLGWDYDKFKIILSPSIYVAILHASTTGSNLRITNTVDGKFAYDLKGYLNLYSIVGIDDMMMDAIKTGNYMAFPEIISNTFNDIKGSIGFDFEATVSYEMYRYLTLIGKVKVPVVPASLTYVVPMTLSSDFQSSVMDLAQGNIEAPSFSYDMGTSQRTIYKINRPMKISLCGNFHPWNGVMEYDAGLGVGIEHPFADDFSETDFYIDYYLGARVGLLNMLNLYFSTERTDRLFIHKLSASLNIRALEVKVGVASESSSLANSFKAGGIGVFVNTSMGL